MTQAEWRIKYRLDPTRHSNAPFKEAPFIVNSKNIVIFGDENLTERYQVFKIDETRLENEIY